MTKNEKPLSRVSPVQYSPRKQSRWVLADYGGKDLWKRWVLSLEWNSESVMEGESGEQVGGELESVTSSAGCFVQGNASTHPHRYLPACKIWLRSDNVGGMGESQLLPQ